MSFQPTPPSFSNQPGFVPPAPMPASTPEATRKRLPTALGILAIVVGLISAAVLLVLSLSAQERAIKAFARAPAQCQTTLDFESTGTFTLFIESKGASGDIGGDCQGNDTSYDNDNTDPDVDLTLTDADDDEIDLDFADSLSYAKGDFVGQAYKVFTIDTPGKYRLAVDSADTDFAIAVGQDPTLTESTLIGGAVASAVGGLLVGGLLLFLGRRRKPTKSSPAMFYPAMPVMPATTPTYEPPYVVGPQGSMPFPAQPDVGPPSAPVGQPTTDPWAAPHDPAG